MDGGEKKKKNCITMAESFQVLLRLQRHKADGRPKWATWEALEAEMSTALNRKVTRGNIRSICADGELDWADFVAVQRPNGLREAPSKRLENIERRLSSLENNVHRLLVALRELRAGSLEDLPGLPAARDVDGQGDPYDDSDGDDDEKTPMLPGIGSDSDSNGE